MSSKNYNRRIHWALYDWANSAFATTVMAGFFPIFFKQYWSPELSDIESTFYLGIGNSCSSLVIVLLAPIIGAIADTGGLRKKMLCAFASIGIVATGSLYLVQAGMWPLAIVLYAIAVIGFSGANTLYDSLLIIVSDTSTRHKTSALGFSLGYLGGGLLFLINILMTQKPTLFGLEDSVEAIKWSFLTVAIWWGIFSVPLLVFIKEPLPTIKHKGTNIKVSLISVYQTLISVRNYRNIWLFLLAYWFYIDGVDTIVRMSVDFGLSIGLSQNDLIKALLLVQFVGFPAALIFGRIGDRFGARAGIRFCIWAYIGITIFAYFLESVIQLYIIALAIGIVQGGIQALSRSLFSYLIPLEKNAEFFGFYNVMGKSAALFGPILVGSVTYTFNSSRLGILSVVILFLIGLFLLNLSTSRSQKNI